MPAFFCARGRREPLKSRFSPKPVLVFFLDYWVKPLLVVALCVAGLIFEFFLELPFIFLIGFHRLFKERNC